MLVCSLVQFASLDRAVAGLAADADSYLNGLVQSNKFSGAALAAEAEKPC
jgi:hypothetical protein